MLNILCVLLAIHTLVDKALSFVSIPEYFLFGDRKVKTFLFDYYLVIWLNLEQEIKLFPYSLTSPILKQVFKI